MTAACGLVLGGSSNDGDSSCSPKEVRDLSDLFSELLLFRDDGLLGTRAHDGILGAHAAVKGTLEFGAKGELAHIVRLFLVEGDTLGGEGLVLHAVEAESNVAELGLS